MNLCGCGCGQRVRRRFAHGHHRRTTFGAASPSWKGDKASYKSIHDWLNTNFTKNGICELCSMQTETDYAFKHHPSPHTRHREDYMELCRSCHHKLDEPTAHRGERLRRQKAVKR